MVSVIPTINELVTEAKNIFLKEFNAPPEVAVSAPGRVNLIGEHTDYNDGLVLPMALPLVTVMVGRKTNNDETVIISTNPDIEPNRVVIQRPVRTEAPKWANYVRGVMANYLGGTAPNFEAVIVTSVPTGSGLSSSAAIEVATYTFLDAISDPQPGIIVTDKALACVSAEHNYVGVPCGIMDQFVSMLGKNNHALLIDCRTYVPTLISFDDSEIVILITNSNVKHDLATGEYGVRRKQCQQAVILLDKFTLRDVKLEDLERLKTLTTDENIIKRARHAITETIRTEKAANALKEKDYTTFGKLMIESHESLRDIFEVSCTELDTLVNAALEVKGVLGARMTGGGFGGCTVTMVYKWAVDDVIKHIKEVYKGTPTFYICTPSDGAKTIQI